MQLDANPQEVKVKNFQIWLFPFMLLLAACAAPGNIEQPPATEASETYTVEPNITPVNVEITLDDAYAVSQLIPSEGGTLTTIGADGTTYTLLIPGDALLNETQITMTPVEEISGMPFGERVLAVQLKPEGLALYNFATLTIVPAEQIPADQQILFDYQGAGQNLGLAAPALDSENIEMQLLHFSGYGVTKGFLADLEPVRQNLGGNQERNLQSLLAEELQRAHQQGENADLAELYSKMQNILQQYSEQVLNPRLAAAGQSCAAGKLAIESHVWYARWMEFSGAGDQVDRETLVNLVAQVGPKCLQEEYELCRDEHIIHRILPAALGLERQFQLVGGVSDAAILPQESLELIEKCLQFELVFQSSNDWSTQGITYHATVSSTIPIRFEDFVIAGQGPIEYEQLEYSLEGCETLSYDFHEGFFEVVAVDFETDFRDAEDKFGYVSDLTLYSSAQLPEGAQTIANLSCQGVSASPVADNWYLAYTFVHLDQLSLPRGSYETGWTIVGGDIYATLDWEKVTELGTVKASFVLFHRPE